MEHVDLLKSGLEELNKITKTDFCLLDEQGQVLADTFAGHENYYKLLEDFNTYDCITEEAAPQVDVQ